MRNKNTMTIAFDMYVLGQGIKTGVYRVCDEILSRISRHDDISFLAVQYSDDYYDQIVLYLNEHDYNWPFLKQIDIRPSRVADVLFSPFFSPWEPWTTDCGLLKVFLSYDLIALKYPQWFDENNSQLVKHIYDNLDGEELIFCISHNTKIDLISYRPDINPDRIIILPLAAGDQFYPCSDLQLIQSVRKKYGIPENVPYFLSLATLEIRKNIDQVIKGFCLFLDKIPDIPVYLVLAGMQGWKLDKIRKTLNSIGEKKNRIIFTGFIQDEDLSAIYSDSICFVYMSLYEGFGLPVLESMKCGTPVISSNSSSLPEVIGDAGILLNPYDSNGLCSAMIKMFEDSHFRQNYSIKGLDRSKKYNWDITVDIMLNAIKSEISRRPKLSIITICFNEKYINDTCYSVVNQSWQDFEWIVVDGGSTDESLNILNQYKDSMQIFISENDDGRYHAMNKGISHARGEYLLFLNGGDYLANNNVLKHIFEYIPISGFENYLNFDLQSDIIYGEILTRETGMMPWPLWTIGPQHFDLEYFSNHSLPHQATFIRRDLFKQYGYFDQKYVYAGDYEWFMRVILKYNASTTYIPIPVSIYNFEGASSKGIESNQPHILEMQKAYNYYKSYFDAPEYKNQDYIGKRKNLKKMRQKIILWLKLLLRPLYFKMKELLRSL